MKRLFAAVGVGLAFSGLTFAQTTGCDEGVIRLSDRSGTVQICSALAQRVPELAGQLKQATAMIGSQQAQIAELTRLVRGLNNVSRDIGLQRQAEMMQSLSAELEKMRRERGREALPQINERLDGLQASLLAALTNPKTAAALTDALKGPVGDAIAKLDLGGASKQIDDISEQLKAIQSSVGNIQGDTTAIRQQLTQMERSQAASGEVQQRLSQETLREVRKMADEFSAIAARAAPLSEPKTYPEIYYAARVLAQKGEIDASLRAFARLMGNRVPLVDPILDWTELLTRLYGRTGAAAYIEKNFKGVMAANTYAYAQQLLSEALLPDAVTLVSEDANAFPPLSLLVAKRLLALAQGSSQRDMPWSTLASLYSLYSQLSPFAKSGEIANYYVDQFRGISQIEEITKGAVAVRALLVKDRVNVSKSPMVLDYTYPPIAAKGGPEAVEIKLWDDAVERGAPVMVCGQNPQAREKCVDLNQAILTCPSQEKETEKIIAAAKQGKTYGGESRPNGCVGFRRDARYTGRVPPRFGGAINVAGLLSVPCIGSVTYTTASGQRIRLETGDLIAVTFNPSSSAIVRTLAQTCGYSYQGI